MYKHVFVLILLLIVLYLFYDTRKKPKQDGSVKIVNRIDWLNKNNHIILNNIEKKDSVIKIIDKQIDKKIIQLKNSKDSTIKIIKEYEKDTVNNWSFDKRIKFFNEFPTKK